MAKGKKQVSGKPPKAKTSDQQKAAAGGDDDFSLQPQTIPADALKPKPKQSALRLHGAAPTQARGKASGEPNVLSYRHQNTRKNNPQVGLVNPESDPDQPKTTWGYDPHLDPALQFDVGRAGVEKLIDDALASGDKSHMQAALQELKRLGEPYLNWAGKAERTSFDVDTVSLYVHERIDPASILAAVRKRMKDAQGKDRDKWKQPDLFAAPFENLPLRDAIDFYKHERGWANRLIAGDSLLVMNSLLQKESMAGQVQMIYIDPPYGIRYGSNFQPFVNKRDVKDRKDEDLTQEPEMIKAFRDTWELGIHSYLTYLRDRLLLAKELLSESGSVFVQISDENLHHVRQIMGEIFGELNFVRVISFKKKSMPLGGAVLEEMNDYLIWYARDITKIKYRQLYATADVQGLYYWNKGQHQTGQVVNLKPNQVANHALIPESIAIGRLVSMTPPSFSEKAVYPFEVNDVEYWPSKGVVVG